MTACADCGARIGADSGHPDGWQLDDGRTVCHACCLLDFKRILAAAAPPEQAITTVW